MALNFFLLPFITFDTRRQSWVAYLDLNGPKTFQNSQIWGFFGAFFTKSNSEFRKGELGPVLDLDLQLASHRVRRAPEDINEIIKVYFWKMTTTFSQENTMQTSLLISSKLFQKCNFLGKKIFFSCQNEWKSVLQKFRHFLALFFQPLNFMEFVIFS